ncbi:MAG: phosphoribosyltransferase [Patescibacteria group bacterium]|nr:MAG: phosphoribosyltransferase [Patescibacteria group bacterium]
MTIFKDRYDAGKQLGETLKQKEIEGEKVIVAISKEGIPVAYEVSKVLKVPFQFLLTEKILLPGKTAIPLGAVAEDNNLFLQEHIIRLFNISDEELTNLVAKAQHEIDRNLQKLRGGQPLQNLRGKTVILVDDVLTSPVVPTVAAKAIESFDPLAVILAIPACDRDVSTHLEGIADEIICLVEPEEFHTPVLWYEERKPVTDEEILTLLQQASSQYRLK